MQSSSCSAACELTLQCGAPAMDKMTVTSLANFVVPMGGQHVELQQVDYVAGGLPLLRTRIREGNRFTIFEIDHETALQWGEALTQWAREMGARNRVG